MSVYAKYPTCKIMLSVTNHHIMQSERCDREKKNVLVKMSSKVLVLVLDSKTSHYHMVYGKLPFNVLLMQMSFSNVILLKNNNKHIILIIKQPFKYFSKIMKIDFLDK